jgi:hypothetical protein
MYYLRSGHGSHHDKEALEVQELLVCHHGQVSISHTDTGRWVVVCIAVEEVKLILFWTCKLPKTVKRTNH